MDVYIDAVEARRNIIRLYESANKSTTAKGYTAFQSKADVALASWIEQYSNLDKAELNRHALRQ
jgi:hypothetical protein